MNEDLDDNTWSFHTERLQLNHWMTHFQQIVSGNRFGTDCM